MTASEIKSITNWLSEKSESIKFGELTINLRLHEGRPAIIERTITERIKSDTGITGGNYEKKSY